MTRRLITLKQIRQEKIARSRSWVFAEIAAKRFPAPLDLGGRGPNLWREDQIDDYVARFIADAEKRANESNGAEQRSKEALVLVARRRARAGG